MRENADGTVTVQVRLPKDLNKAVRIRAIYDDKTIHELAQDAISMYLQELPELEITDKGE